MISLDLIAALSIAASLTFYALLGGADYGGGVWDLLASGPRAREQRRLITDAIGPIWEANHVWLIFVIVILFTAFPPAFAAIAIALHIPLTLMLIGIVMRGSAFTFRHYDVQEDEVQRRWGMIFAVASLITPVLLGIVIGAIASGRIRVEDGAVVTDFITPWLAPFPISVGLFALALFAYLAAVYLTLEAEDPELREDFRRRALISAAAAGAMALVVFLLSETGAPLIRRGFGAGRWWPPVLIAAGALAAGAIFALLARRFRIARACAAGQTALILWGWALAQYPYLVVPDITISQAAAPPETLRLLVGGIAIGSLMLFPSFYYLFRIFKGGSAFAPLRRARRP